jgi:hypothetical protein
VVNGGGTVMKRARLTIAHALALVAMGSGGKLLVNDDDFDPITR